MLAGGFDHIQEIGRVRRFRSMAPSKTRTKGTGCQHCAGEMLIQLLTGPVSRCDLVLWRSFHKDCVHLFVRNFASYFGFEVEDEWGYQKSPEGEVRSVLFRRETEPVLRSLIRRGPADSKAIHAAFF